MRQVRVIKEFCNLPVGLELTLNQSTSQYEVGERPTSIQHIGNLLINDFFQYTDYSSVDEDIVNDYMGVYFEEVISKPDYMYVKSRVIKSYVDDNTTHYIKIDGSTGEMPNEFFNELFDIIK